MSESHNPASTDDPQSKFQQYTENFSESAREHMSTAAHQATDTARAAGQHYVAEPASDIVSLMRDYAREKPDVAALWCFGLGFLVGWKVRG